MTAPDEEGSLGVAGPRDIEGLRRFSHEAMHTVYEVYAVHPDAQYAAQAAQAAFTLVDRLEDELSRFRSNSDISRINDLRSGGHVRVGTAALECLVIAQHMYALTGGAFDVSIGTGLPSLELDPDQCVVHATADGVRVDLGGIGKGYAVDLVGELLEEWDITRAMVHGGFSSVLVLDAPGSRDGWPLTLSDPADRSRVLERLSLTHTALGASGVRKAGHIVDPQSGAPVRGQKATWVALPRPARATAGGTAVGAVEGPGSRLAPAAIADALTTAFMVLSVEEVEALCARTPGLDAWLLPDGGTGLIYFGA